MKTPSISPSPATAAASPRSGGDVAAFDILSSQATRMHERLGDFQSWLSRQPVAVEAAVAGAVAAVQGAVVAGFVEYVADEFEGVGGDAAGKSPALPTGAPKAFCGGHLVQARNFGVFAGVNAGISTVMKRIKGAEDLQSSMVAAFGSGAAYSLVSSDGGPHKALKAVMTGLAFALAQGGFFKLRETFFQPMPNDAALCSRAQTLLTTQGIQNCERNLEEGMLANATSHLFSDREHQSLLMDEDCMLL